LKFNAEPQPNGKLSEAKNEFLEVPIRPNIFLDPFSKIKKQGCALE